MLEREIAALSHFIRPVVKTQYFRELPENIATPSVYFPEPELIGNEHSLNRYKNSFALYVKIFGRDNMESYAKASEIVRMVQAAKKLLQIYDMEGKLTGENFLIRDISIKKIDDGVTKMTVAWDSFAAYDRQPSAKSEELCFGGLAVSRGQEGQNA